MVLLIRRIHFCPTPLMFAMKSAIWISSSEFVNGLNCDSRERYVAAFGVEMSADCTPSRYRRAACGNMRSCSRISMESLKACARSFAESMQSFRWLSMWLAVSEGVFSRNACTDCTTVSVIVAGMASSSSSCGAVLWIVFRVNGMSGLYDWYWYASSCVVMSIGWFRFISRSSLSP